MSTSNVERRYTPGRVEMRQRDSQKRIGGYAAVFERASQNLGGFIEVVSRSFFNKSRGDGWPDVIARYNHDDNMLLGTTAARTLTLEIDNHGLLYEVVPPQSRADILELVERGDVTKSSFAFRVFEDDWGLSEQNFPQRTLVSGQLVDVAPVNSPAYLDTSAGLRSLAKKVEADVEEIRNMAQRDELRKLFIRTDNKGPAPKPRTFGPAALIAAQALAEDPLAKD